MRIAERLIGGLLFSCIVTVPTFAGFASQEQYLAAVGRLSGANGAEFYTTIWATNLTGVPVSFTFDFLKAGQANTSPASFTDNLAPGQTKVYENVVQSKLGLSGVLGGARVTSTGEILVAERIYNQAPGADLGDTEGLFFAGVPKTFSIALGQSASIQGINQGGAEDFRYNFALLETGGGTPTVNVQLFDGNGAMAGQKAYQMQPYEQIQPNVKELFAGVSTTNGRITATVTGGTGSVIIAGAQVANVSQDSSGFEMSFRDSILTSGGGGGGLSTVIHNATLAGDGTPGSPLSVAAPLSIATASFDAISGSYTSGGGSNAGVFGSSASATGFGVHGHGVVNNTDGYLGGSDYGVFGLATDSAGVGVYGKSSASYGVRGDGLNGKPGVFGTTTGSGPSVQGQHPSGNNGYLGGPDYAVFGDGNLFPGVLGRTNSNQGGVHGETSLANGWGVVGTNTAENNATGYLGGNGVGVEGDNSALAGFGVHGNDTSTGTTGTGVLGESLYGNAVDGLCGTSNCTAIHGASTGIGYAGIFEGKVGINGDLIVNGNLSKGGGSFKIDDPLDPANKYLYHSFVESPDMKNIYDGVVTLGPTGSATVSLPAWFDALNRDFRYQLTALGTPQAGLFIARKVEHNRFTIAGGVAGAEVSWQVTGTRQDAWANAHRIPTEVAKSEDERGRYLHPELFGQPASKSIEMIKRRGGRAEHDAAAR